MANESVVLWVDVENNTLLTGWESNTPAQRPSFKQGDNIKVEMHFVRRVSTNTGIYFDEVPTAGASIRLAVGNPDAIPTGGTWTLDFGGEQADFLYNASAASVQTALNAFASITALGGVTVEKVNGDTTYRISFNNKVALTDDFTGDGTNLLPSSSVIIDEIKVGSPTVRGVWQIKPTQVPVAYQGAWTAQDPSAISTSVLQSGTTRVKIDPSPKDGTFTLSVGAFNTAPISVYATALDVQNAISAVVDGFEVQKSGAFIWDVSQNTTPLLSITANGAGLISFDSIVGEVNFNNYETATLLAGATTKNTTLEIEMTIGSSVATVLQTPCTIISNLINETIFAPTPFEEHLTPTEANALFLKQASNLSDLANTATARTNLSVYSIAQTDGLLALKADLSHTHGISDVTGLQTALDGKANLSGATFTGGINLPSRTAGGVAYLNLGVVPNNLTAPTTLVEGDIYLTDSDSSSGFNTRLNYNGKNFGGTVTQYSLAVLQNTNFFTQPQTISCNTTGTQSALRVTNTGTGESLRIEDETNPDSTPFVVGADGRVGIGGTTAINPNHKLAIYNGNIVFSAGYGLAFGDGTTQTTAFNPSGYATESWVLGLGYLTVGDYPITALTSASFKLLNGTATSTYTHTYYDPYGDTYADIEISVSAPSGIYYDNWGVGFSPAVPLGTVTEDGISKTLTIGVQPTAGQTMQDAINNYFTGSGSVLPSGWTLTFSNSGSPYAPSDALASSTTIVIPSLGLQDGYKPVLTGGGIVYDLTLSAIANGDYNKVLSTDANGVVGWNSVSNYLAGYALLSGATFTGKVVTAASNVATAGFNIQAGSAPTSPLGGDIWFQTGGNYLYYRSHASANTLTMAVHQLTNTFSSPQIIDTTSNTLAGLRVTQKGTFPALVVEDATNPDTSSFVVNANGFVGIQRDPATWTPAAGVVLDANGKGVFTPTTAYAGINIGTVTATPTTLANGDVWIGDQLSFRNRNGQDRQVAVLNTSNLFSGATTVNPIISITQTSSAGGLTVANSGSGSAVRVTQTGSGHAIVVEDATSPDTNSFVIDSNGNVGIGVDPATFTATEKLEVKGNIKFNDGTVQSTAFTTAQLPTAATASQARFITNATNYLTPNTAHWMLMNPNIVQIQRAGFTVTNTGTITLTNAGWIASNTRTGTAGACSSRWRTFGVSQVDQVWSSTDKSRPTSWFDFSNPAWLSGRTVCPDVTDSVFSWWFYHGKAEADGVGDIARMGFGWKVTGGAGSRFLTLHAHNGTTLSAVTSTYAVTSGVAFDWDLISNGAGTVTLYVNGTLVATSTGGPTGNTNITPVVWEESVATSAAATSPFNGMVHSRGKLITFDP